VRELEESLSQSRATHRVTQFAGLFLGLELILRSYHMRELLICWLCFSIAFVSLTIVILSVVLACYTGKYLIQWICYATALYGKWHLGDTQGRLPNEPQLPMMYNLSSDPHEDNNLFYADPTNGVLLAPCGSKPGLTATTLGRKISFLFESTPRN
jgi:hypothetical protein